MAEIRAGVLVRPFGLRLTALFMSASIPFVLLEFAQVRSIWPEVFSGNRQTIVAALLVAPLAAIVVSILRARRLAFYSAIVISVFWTLMNIYLFYETKRPTFAFFAFFVAVYWMLVLIYCHRQMHRTFLDPGLAWYQELPEHIPELKAVVVEGDESYSLMVGQFGYDGGFLYFPGKQSARLSLQKRLFAVINPKRMKLVFEFKKFVVSTEARLIRVFEGARGFGVEFNIPNADEKKNLYDLIAQLKGEGYVE